MKETIIEADYLITCNPKNSVIKNAAILIIGDEIKALGSKKEIHKDYSASTVISGENKILMPGLVNTHSHSVQTLLRGKADDLALLDWLKEVVIPGESNFTADDVHTSSLLGFAEMIRTGTTTANDMLSTNNAESGIQSAIESGIRTRIGKMLMDVNPNSPTERLDDTDEIIKTINHQIKKYHYTQNQRIKYTLNARFLLSCSPELMKGIVETQEQYDDLMIHTHASESQAECKAVENYYKTSYIRALRDIGALGSETIIAHGIWLDEEEYNILKKTDTRLTHNPSSNSKLASGICDVKKYLELGIIVGLATDGAPCNNNLDMFREMRLATFLQKVKHLNEKILPAQQVLRMATIEGARAINWDKEIGSIEEGKKADVIQIDISDIDALPIYDPVSHVVYSASGKDVSMTMIDGSIVYQDKEFKNFNLNDLRNKVSQYKEKWSH
ncbi:MAG: amidohydrolase family protein [Candidatus Heimdallarchaeota archaeon]|nr:amidohydrolase family protein [Candidatus Heimdallarchaeota archaeon]